MYFASNTSQTHPLKYLLGLHTKVSEAWELDNECSIDLLERILRGDAFKRVNAYLKIERSISRCYQVLQSIYQDELAPAQAQAALDKYLKNPSAHDPPHNTIEEVFLHIHMLCSRIHSLEMEPAKQQNTLSSVFSAIRWYLQANFIEREVKQLYLDFDEIMNDHKSQANSSYAFWILKSLTKRRFIAMSPRHQLQKTFENKQPLPPNGGFKHKKISQSLRPMCKMEEIKPLSEDSHQEDVLEQMMEELDLARMGAASGEDSKIAQYEESEDENEEEKLANAYVEANSEECFIVDNSTEDAAGEGIPCPEDEVLEATPQVDYSKMKFSENVKCRLCGCSASPSTHSPPFFRSCTFFRGQLPQKIQRRCCGGFHAALASGTICPVVKALGPRTFKPLYNKPLFRQNQQQRFQPRQTSGGYQIAQRQPGQGQSPAYNQPNRQVF
jgi:hypothetical protein